MAIDRKYGRVTLEHGTIGDDEPVFVLRGQDRLAPELIRIYAQICLEEGSPVHHFWGAITAGAAMWAWQQDNVTQTPQSNPPAAASD